MSNECFTVFRIIRTVALMCVLFAGMNTAYANDDRIELEVTRIKANQELPQILYVVPWKDVSGSQDADQKLVLHDFFGDLYDPVLPSSPSAQSKLIQNATVQAIKD